MLDEQLLDYVVLEDWLFTGAKVER